MSSFQDRSNDGFLLDDHLVLPSYEESNDIVWHSLPPTPLVWVSPPNDNNKFQSVPYSQEREIQDATIELVASQLPLFVNHQTNLIQTISSSLLSSKTVYEHLCSVITVFHYLRTHPEILSNDHSKHPIIMAQIKEFRIRADKNKKELVALSYVRKYISEIHHTLNTNHLILVTLDGAIEIQEKIQQKYNSLMRHMNGIEVMILKHSTILKMA